MGDFNVKPILNEQERIAFYHAMIDDLDAFDLMLKNQLFDPNSNTIGAEQELCIIDKYGYPSPNALNLLDHIDDDHFTNELALFNLEINMDPLSFTENCFQELESALKGLIKKGQQEAIKENSHIYMCGILPTVNFRNLEFDFMTPIPRYKLLSEELLKIRGSHFEIAIEGVDDFQSVLESVLFEACNTSFQMHLQINPASFVQMHNWAQMISGPVLSGCCNSPLLFGKELWTETRIALFKQSLETNNLKNYSREILPRVYFGNKWLKSSASELWKEDLIRFPVLLRGIRNEPSLEVLKKGGIPDLKSIRLHNGTTYTWNRLCYGVSKNVPHLRIECRYLPSGPTIVDEISNFAFWAGLMKGMPESLDNFWLTTDFRIAKHNFLQAAKTGIHSILHWFGKDYPAYKLICEELLPLAQKGLRSMNIAENDISTYLSVIESRAISAQTGSQWLKKNFRKLTERFKPALANQILVQESLHYQEANTPVSKWKDIPVPHYYAFQNRAKSNMVETIMNREVITVYEKTSITTMKKIMEWKGFHHLPVEDYAGNLLGMVSDSLLQSTNLPGNTPARDIMTRELIHVVPHESISKARFLMEKYNIHCLPVVEKGKLVGILTANDFKNIEMENKQHLILIVGLPGSGKTTLAENLAAYSNFTHISSDVIRAHLGLKGQYEDVQKAIVYDTMVQEAEKNLLAGNSVIIDATLYKNDLRKPYVDLSEKYHVPMYWIVLQTDEETIQKRVSQKRAYSEANFSVYQTIKKQFEPLVWPNLLLDTSKLPMSDLIKKTMEYINQA